MDMEIHKYNKFSESFWEIDFNGTLGFELLCKRIRDGQKSSKDIEDFFKKKSKAESQYGKALRNLARMADGKEESGDLGLGWQELKSQTERAARLHKTSAENHALLAEELARFADNMKTEPKQHEDRVKDKQKMKRTAHSKMTELQRSYLERCREHIQYELQHGAASKSGTVSCKDIEKVRIKSEKCKELMEKADGQYRAAVEALEQIRRAWEADMEEACKVFQRADEARIFLVRDLLWRCTNLDSQLCVDRDQCCENVRDSLERCDVTHDVCDFIQHFMTGNIRPAPIPYENYFSDSRVQNSPNTLPRRRRPKASPIATPPASPLCSSNRAVPQRTDNAAFYSDYSYAYK
ncbi:proline-serine-threonine phosphatase-interacting protein 1-like [Mya arenaria]|uniref:proline-serine-threonine phosphatase-interacting protein 1-like n=1 Tax=Mya arenaria TaxID=6604 RepID=UPI0022E1D572|nr:proline-serine-threonine phosphatase-interacting protein 1-like [Mya arenaria]